jgi:serine-type D-Ala-D-Ala carboxypeptidase/endopeptidase (penicillin-binding protein 4)
VESPLVGDIVAAMLRESDNQTAELLMKEVGRTTGHPSTAGGGAVVASTLGRAAPADGSGLSLDDRATCQELLEVFDRPVVGEAIDDGLAVAGRSGTLTRRFVDTPLAGRLRAKSGSLNTVRSLSGAVEDDDGVLRFASIITVPDPGPVPSSTDSVHQRLGEILLAYPRLADPEALVPVDAGGT